MATALIIDPGLLREQGHNFGALLRLKAELSKLGVNCAGLASIQADAVVRSEAKPALPTKGLWWRSQDTPAEFSAHAAEMAKQLSLALSDQERPPDLLVLPCCDAVQVQAVALHLQRRKWVPAPHLVMWFLFPERLEEYRTAFSLLKEAVGDDRKIAVYCETSAMAAALSSFIGLEARVAPGANLAGANGKSRGRSKNASPKVVSVGFGNRAKGYHLLPEAVEQVLRANSEATFLIHGVLSNSDQADDTTIFQALSKMGPRVVTSSAVLDSEEYLSYLLQADLLLLPYDEKVYEIRGSGVFNEAIEIGIPIVATRGCSFAQPAFDQGWGVEIADRSGVGVAQAILTALDRLPDLNARAAIAAKGDLTDAGTALRKAVGGIAFFERLQRVAAGRLDHVLRRRPVESLLPDSFFLRAGLLDGATVRSDPLVAAQVPTSEESSYKPIELAVLTGAIVDTSAVPYRYSVLLHVDAAIARQLTSGSLITIEISIEVLAGMVGIVWADEGYNPLQDTERYAPAEPGVVQRVVISIPSEQAQFVVLRNVAPGATAASFRISQFRAWSVVDAKQGIPSPHNR